ncbi:hypothetical protein [Enhygromyxa salina]|uniref:hypothetical protein n=1 Tax=Enhygromyxa salina TaxID=215803 RepID=UPI000D04229B|nr:hypothetical protein [Enhygromyxa salina]
MIQSIDGVEPKQTRDAYELLATRRRHELTVSNDASADVRDVTIRYKSSQPTEVSLVSLDALNTTPLAARGQAWGHRFPFDDLHSSTDSWRIPADPWGGTWMFLAGSGVLEAPTVAGLSVPLFVDVNHELSEAAGRTQSSFPPPGIIEVTPERDSRSTLLLTVNLPTYWLPMLVVVDCHGIVRWSLGSGIGLDADLDAAVREANSFAQQLEAEREAGGCWVPAG